MNFSDFENFCERVDQNIRDAASILYFLNCYKGDRCASEETNHECTAMSIVEESLRTAIEFIDETLGREQKKEKSPCRDLEVSKGSK